ITGVPTYVVGQRGAVGAQSYEVLEDSPASRRAPDDQQPEPVDPTDSSAMEPHQVGSPPARTARAPPAPRHAVSPPRTYRASKPRSRNAAVTLQPTSKP